MGSYLLLFLVILAPLIASVVFVANFGQRGWERFRASSLSLMGFAYLSPVIIFIWGGVMSWNGPEEKAPVWPAYTIAGIGIGFLLLCVYAVLRAAGFRLVTFMVLLPAGWFSLIAMLLALGMVTND